MSLNDALAIHDAPATRTWWRDDVPHCPACDAPLSEEGSITHTERYAASMSRSGFRDAIDRSHVDFWTEACCASCGQLLDYDDVVGG